jgi:alpha-tubulin suppressor-like RCC1 family protein
MADSATLKRLDGSVHQIPLDAETPIKMDQLDLPPVKCMAASQYHALFYTDTPKEIYGLGSNRFAQLGSPEPSSIPAPQVITFFEGLEPHNVQLSCGISHSAFVLDQDLYTCGLSNEGSLGSGKEHGEAKGYPQLAVFEDNEGKLCDVQVVKVACGSLHTVAVDGRDR